MAKSKVKQGWSEPVLNTHHYMLRHRSICGGYVGTGHLTPDALDRNRAHDCPHCAKLYVRMCPPRPAVFTDPIPQEQNV